MMPFIELRSYWLTIGCLASMIAIGGTSGTQVTCYGNIHLFIYLSSYLHVTFGVGNVLYLVLLDSFEHRVYCELWQYHYL